MMAHVVAIACMRLAERNDQSIGHSTVTSRAGLGFLVRARCTKRGGFTFVGGALAVIWSLCGIGRLSLMRRNMQE